MTNQRLDGYRELAAWEIEAINDVKRLEGAFADHWQAVRALPGVDPRWLAVARTRIEEGCSAMVKAIARPSSPWDGPFPTSPTEQRRLT